MAALLERIGLHRPELRAGVTYDWANSVFITAVAQIFQIYFARALRVRDGVSGTAAM